MKHLLKQVHDATIDNSSLTSYNRLYDSRFPGKCQISLCRVVKNQGIETCQTKWCHVYDGKCSVTSDYFSENEYFYYWGTANFIDTPYHCGCHTIYIHRNDQRDYQRD